jgi:hypothetical protein
MNILVTEKCIRFKMNSAQNADQGQYTVDYPLSHEGLYFNL